MEATYNQVLLQPSMMSTLRDRHDALLDEPAQEHLRCRMAGAGGELLENGMFNEVSVTPAKWCVCSEDDVFLFAVI